MRAIFLSPFLSLALALSGCATTAAKVQGVGEVAHADDAAWKLLDTNGDGYLSRSELESQHAVGLLRDMHRADSNEDDRVSLAEWQAWWPTEDISQPAASMKRLNQSAAPLN